MSDKNNTGLIDEKDRLEGLPTEDEVENEAKANLIFKVAKVEYGVCSVMALMFFIISYIYSVGRLIKDSVVLGRQTSSSIAFLKFFAVLPSSIISVVFLQYYLSKYPLRKVFDGALIIFSVLFVAIAILTHFSDYVQPNRYIPIDYFADGKFKCRKLTILYPIVMIFFEWTSTLIYVLAELFGNVVLSFMFMSFSNSVTTPKQSARFIPLFYIGSNISLFLSGSSTKLLYKLTSDFKYDTINLINNGFFVLFGVFCLIIFFLKKYLENTLLAKPIFIRKSTETKKKSKVSVGVVEGIKEMMKSKLLLNISAIALFYAFSTNIIEASYKSGLEIGATALGKQKNTYSKEINSYEQMFVSIIVVIVLISPFPRLIQTRGWFSVAILCPIVAIISACMVFFMAFINFPARKGQENIVFKSFGYKSESDAKYLLENILGAIAVGLMKFSKYAAFDIAKEAISMQIDASVRPRYKGIFDGVCGKLGKSLGSLYVMNVVGFLNTLDSRKAAPVSMLIVVLLALCWAFSVWYLSRKYEESVSSNTPIDIDPFTKEKDSKVSHQKPEEESMKHVEA